MRGKCFSSGARGGSVVEILVVIAIIGAMTSLALPVFHRARERAIQAVCQNHLKQMGLATRLYLQYNDNTYFPYCIETPEGSLYYYGLERTRPDGATEIDVTRGYLFPYYSMVDGVERCPAFQSVQTNGQKLRGATLGYGYNCMGLSGRSQSTIASPEKILLFGDCAHVVLRGPSYKESELVVEEYRFISPTLYSVHFRHAGQANLLFCDGHVESREPYRVVETFPQSRVGRLGKLGDTSLFIP